MFSKEFYQKNTVAMRYIQLFIGKYADLLFYYEGCYTEFIVGVVLGNGI